MDNQDVASDEARAAGLRPQPATQSSQSSIANAGSLDEMLAMSDEEFEAHWDDKFAAISRVYSLRTGHTLTQEDFDAIQKFDADCRENEQTALDAFHRGHKQGLREGGSADIEQMSAKLDKQFCELGVEKAMRSLAERRVDEMRADIRHFIHALDRGYLDCKDDSAFIDALRAHVTAVQQDAPK